MKIIVSGHGMDVGSSLETHIKDSLEKCVSKYFENPTSAKVTFEKSEHKFFKAHIAVNEGTGKRSLVVATAEEHDAYKSYEEALTKVERQLRKYKARIKNHHKNKEVRLLEARKFVMSPFGEDAHAEAEAPTIIAETSTEIERLTVGDAVMKMDMMDLPALMFVNRSSERLNLVYYRKDGNIAWVDAPSA